ncbi:hypothetical protein EVAR_47716_1 [Eumeta japonica]|uniref:Uncharacterized protein n=1 Tax=Eumeta variegata TaxID=151549 RepID=A0A4C1VUM4_EUMVA|nr:hypothetical protein EVAR_47716_1 [Eumeta japonica]
MLKKGSCSKWIRHPNREQDRDHNRELQAAPSHPYSVRVWRLAIQAGLAIFMVLLTTARLYRSGTEAVPLYQIHRSELVTLWEVPLFVVPSFITSQGCTILYFRLIKSDLKPPTPARVGLKVTHDRRHRCGDGVHDRKLTSSAVQLNYCSNPRVNRKNDVLMKYDGKTLAQRSITSPSDERLPGSDPDHG